jgi:Transposase DDE domain
MIYNAACRAMAANPSEGSRLLWFWVKAPNTNSEIGTTRLARACARNRQCGIYPLGRKPEQASADSGYCSQTNLEALESRLIDGYVATGRAKDAAKDEVGLEATDACVATNPPQPAKPPTRVEAMRAKIKAGAHSSPYRLRKQRPEPVFGQIKQARGFRQFLMRGLEKVKAEWALICTAHNILKLAQGRSLSAAKLMGQKATLAAA